MGGETKAVVDKVVSLEARRPEKPDPNKLNNAYKQLVMKKFADFEHADKREFLDRRAEVERAARRKL